MTNFEIFPKQDFAKDGPGNPIKLPFGTHRKTGMPAVFVDEDFQPYPDWGLEALKAVAGTAEQQLDAAIEELGTDKNASLSRESVAVEKTIEECAFIRHCRDDAASLSEPEWFAMMSIMAALGETARAKAHELSRPYPKYTRAETDKKFDQALEAKQTKKVGPHTCGHIRNTLGFDCPKDCQALCKSGGRVFAKSPAALGTKLAKGATDSTYVYFEGGKKRLDATRLANDLIRDFSIVTLNDTEEILVYTDGVYRRSGESFLKGEIERLVPNEPGLITNHSVNEILGHIKRSTYASRVTLDADPEVINVENGLLNVRTRELSPHTPSYLSTVRVRLVYDPNAQCPLIRGFLSEVLEPEDIPIIEELAGFILYKIYLIQKCTVFVGQGANGKSVLIFVLSKFAGDDNCSSVPLQDLEEQRFAKSALYGKLLNACGDLPARPLKSTAIFKKLTGGDGIFAEEKFKRPFSFVNYAKLLFSANVLPLISRFDDIYAFWRRWLILVFPNTFAGLNDDKFLRYKLTTTEELSGLLNLALAGLDRLLETGDFSSRRTVDEIADLYLSLSDSVYVFLKICCCQDPLALVERDALYGAYVGFCRGRKIPALASGSFFREVEKQSWKPVRPDRIRTTDKRRPYVFRGIALAENVEGQSSEKTPAGPGGPQNLPLWRGNELCSDNSSEVIDNGVLGGTVGPGMERNDHNDEEGAPF